MHTVFKRCTVELQGICADDDTIGIRLPCQNLVAEDKVLAATAGDIVCEDRVTTNGELDLRFFAIFTKNDGDILSQGDRDADRIVSIQIRRRITALYTARAGQRHAGDGGLGTVDVHGIGRRIAEVTGTVHGVEHIIRRSQAGQRERCLVTGHLIGCGDVNLLPLVARSVQDAVQVGDRNCFVDQVAGADFTTSHNNRVCRGHIGRIDSCRRCAGVNFKLGCRLNGIRIRRRQDYLNGVVVTIFQCRTSHAGGPSGF